MARVSVASYLGLSTGPSFLGGSEVAQSFPVDGSKASLRAASPFTIRVVPPPTLLAALAGQGEATRSGIFDAALAQQRAEVEAGIAAGTTTQEQLDQLTGTRAPATPSFAVIDAALATTTNFRQVQEQRKAARSLFTGQVAPPTQLIGGNGRRFTDQKPAEAADMALSDLAQAKSMLAQVQQMLSTPALTLLINPQNMTLTFTKKQAYQDRGRQGYIFQSWGEDLGRLSVTGKTGAFYAGTTGVNDQGQTDSPSGVQWITRRESASWHNLASLLLLYRSNGVIYDVLGQSEAHLWVGAIEISYDQMVYQGQFESFQYGFSEEQQGGGLDFSFEFTVSASFDLNQRGPVLPQASTTPSPSDPRWLDPLKPSSGFGGPPVRAPEPDSESSTAILDPFVR